MKIPFSPPRIDDKTIEAVKETLLSGWITSGPKTAQFEEELSNYIGVENVLCLNSATAGLQLALEWLGIRKGDEVIVPCYTYCATANVVLQKGAKPIMIDINQDDFNINTNKIKEAITKKTKAIISVDIAGYPVDYDKIKELICSTEITTLFNGESDNQKKMGRIAFISDAAHSIGAVYKGKKTGNHADISSFSFHAVKNLTTAEGGAVAFNLPNSFDNKKVKNHFKILSLHGQTKDALTKNKAGSWEYDVIKPGYKCNMTDIQAAIGLVELNRYNQTLNRRKEIFKAYDDFFKKFDWAITPKYESTDKLTSYHLYMLRINNCSKEQRNTIIELISSYDVAVNVHYKPLPLLTVYKNEGYKMSDFPQANANYEHEISLPVYYDLTNEQIKRVVDVIKKAVESILC